MASGFAVSLLQVLECPICLQVFDGTTRLAKSLLCGHTLCHPCIEEITTENLVSCPTCREITPKSKVLNNFTVNSMVANLCQSCFRNPRGQFCSHCSFYLCTSCFEGEHLLGDTKKKIQGVTEVVADGEKAMRTTIRSDVQDNLKDLSADVSALKDTLDRTMTEIESKMLKAANIDEYEAWAEKLQVQIQEARNFLKEQKELMSNEFPPENDAEKSTLVSAADKCESLVKEITELIGKAPQTVKYDYRTSELLSEQFLDQVRLLDTTTNSGKQTTSDDLVACDLGASGSQPNAESPQLTKGARTASRIDFGRVEFRKTRGAYGGSERQFDEPCDVVILPNGLIWVTDSDNHRIKVFDTNFEVLHCFGDEGTRYDEFYQPAGICVSAECEVFIADGERGRGRVQVYSIEGDFLRSIGRFGEDSKILKEPRGLALGPDDKLYVVDQGDYCVKVFNTNGNYERTIGRRGRGPKRFNALPDFIAVTSDGRVLVSDHKGIVRVFSPEGEFLDNYPKDTSGNISGLAVDCDDNILMCDDDGGQILLLDSRGFYRGCLGQYGGQLSGIDVDRNGTIVVCDRQHHKIHIQKFYTID